MDVIDRLQQLFEGSSSNKAIEYFQQARENHLLRRYEKYGKVKAIVADKKIKVETIINGQIETTNTANPGDYIVTGVKGEKYVISADKFKSRYRHVSGDTYEATGSCWAVKYIGPTFTFKAPWGEQMICHKNDYICSTTYNDDNDVYRIEKQAFLATYKLPPQLRTV